MYEILFIAHIRCLMATCEFNTLFWYLNKDVSIKVIGYTACDHLSVQCFKFTT